jgi:carboxymethylenebutenolidase
VSQRAAVLTERFPIDVGDGTSMDVYIARPAISGPSAGVIVAGELFGVSAHVRDVCERLAELGYVALAPDLYHRSAPGIELAHDGDGRERGFELLHQMTRPQALADLRAAGIHLRTTGATRVGMIGLSVGGHLAYLAATDREVDLAAAVVAYGGWIPTTDIPLGQPTPTLADTAAITGRILVLVGENDHVVPPEHRQAIRDALRSAGVRHEMLEFAGAPHGFLCDRRDSFDPEAARDAWQRIDELFAAELR